MEVDRKKATLASNSWLETLFDDLRLFQEYLQCTWLVKDQK